MKLVFDNKGWTFTRDSGEEVELSYREINFIEPEYGDIVFDIANENGIWRDDS